MITEKLTPDHDASEFDCSDAELNQWLRKYSLVSLRARSATTYVIADENTRILGFYALTNASVTQDEATPRAKKGIGRHDVPAILIARLGVDKSQQGTGLGAKLLKDALERCLAAADIIAARVILVHAINAKARSFYEHFEFESSPIDEYTMMLMVKDLEENL